MVWESGLPRLEALADIFTEVEIDSSAVHRVIDNLEGVSHPDHRALVSTLMVYPPEAEFCATTFKESN